MTNLKLTLALVTSLLIFAPSVNAEDKSEETFKKWDADGEVD